MIIGIPTEIDSTSIHSDAFEQIEEFNVSVYQNIPKGKKFRYGRSIYENTGDSIEVKEYDATTTYTAGEYIFGDPYEINRTVLHKVVSTGGAIQKKPQDYTYDDSIAYETSLIYKNWVKRYVQLCDTFTDGVATLTYNNVVYTFFDNYDGTCDIKMTFGIDKIIVKKSVPLHTDRVLNDTFDTQSYIYYPDTVETNAFFVPTMIVIGDNGKLYTRTHISTAMQMQTDGVFDIMYFWINTPTEIDGVVKVENTNKMKAFDNKNYTATKANGSLKVDFKSIASFNSVALTNIMADSVIVSIKNSGGTEVAHWEVTPDTLVDDDGVLTPTPTTEILYTKSKELGLLDTSHTVFITLLGDSIELGNVFVTKAIDTGFTNLAIENSYKDFSTFTYDPWGNANYVERAKVSTYKATVDILIKNYDKIDRLMKKIGKNVVVIDGADNYDEENRIFVSTQRVGRITSFSQRTAVKNNDLARVATYSFNIEEIV